MSSLTRKFRQSKRAIVALSLAALFSAWSPIAVFAQDGIVARQQTASPTTQQQTQPAQNPITKPLALSPDIPPSSQRVGIKEGQTLSLPLQDAITMALQNNLDIEQFRQSVRISEYSLFSLRGFYDITSGSGIGYRSAISPTSSTLGGSNSGTLSNKLVYYNFTTSKQFETGGNLAVEFDNSRTKTSNIFAQLNPQYSNTLTFSYTQPILRNFSLDSTRRSIQVAKKSLDLSDSQFRQRTIEVINSVQRAYWDLVYARRNEQIARDSVDLAKQQLENNQKMVEAGTLAPIELRSTEAQLENAKGNVIIALQGITTAENALKILLMKDPADKVWDSEVLPTDEPLSAQHTFELEEATRLALKNRPELEQMKLQTEQKEIDIKFYKNQLKPQLDLVGTYTNNGLAGMPSQAVVIGGGSAPPERLQGGYLQSLNNLFSQDFRTYQIGVVLSFPWRNRTAKGNLGRALAESRQLDARQRQLIESVQVDVRNALQAVEAARQRYEAATAGELAADAQYKGEQERYRAGLSTNFVVLQRQTDLSVARGTKVRALTDYNKALADLQRVTGMTLMSNNVQISSKDN